MRDEPVWKDCADVATVPYAVAKDVVTLGGTMTDQRSAVVKKLEQIKEEAED